MAISRPLNPSIIGGFIVELEIRKLIHSKQSLRTDLGPLEELMSSILDNGLLHPIVVRPLEDKFEVIAGNRRLEACKRLSLRKINCHVIELDDKEAYEISLVENLQHSALDPFEEASALKKYVDELGYGSISELARRIHKSQTYVTRRIQLADEVPVIRSLISSNQLTPSIAQEIAGLGYYDKKVLAQAIVKNNLSRNRVRQIVRQMKSSTGINRGLENHQQLLSTEARRHRAERIIAKSIASLKLSMSRLSEILEDTEDNFILREIMFNWRIKLNQQIDLLLKLKSMMKQLSIQEFDEIS
jgi:ParB family chromosome partitioning protein